METKLLLAPRVWKETNHTHETFQRNVKHVLRTFPVTRYTTTTVRHCDTTHILINTPPSSACAKQKIDLVDNQVLQKFRTSEPQELVRPPKCAEQLYLNSVACS